MMMIMLMIMCIYLIIENKRQNQANFLFIKKKLRHLHFPAIPLIKTLTVE